MEEKYNFCFKRQRGEDFERRKTAWARPGGEKEPGPYLGNEMFPGLGRKSCKLQRPGWRDH